jgi:hypothetical protein
MPVLLAFLFGWFHPFFVSVVEINHNATEKTLEISVRIFTDDFENTLNTRFPGNKVDLYHPTKGATDSLMSRYIREKLNLKVNGKQMNMTYIGFERVEESIWCYMEIDNVPVVNQLHVSNKLLYEYKKEQINMQHVTVGKERKSYKLDNPDSEVDFSF